ncbi:putative pentatricopeptide repeat-containing protein [Vitis vinifera]|uniref:Putative pentatricopeptide repeat-containing protein n=1 Tax=Vitis vinifera TaxID=29760 RepID=A0A438J5L0_VITVI|nr:putative pentatricopeptide repeat-containing protein [Vitis vinifera]
MDMYAKCGRIEDAAKLFDHMPDKTVVSWTSMMSGHCQRGAFDENSLIDGYTKSGTLVAAEKLMKRLTCRDVVSWTSVISGCVLNGMWVHGLVMKAEWRENVFVMNSLVEMYSINGYFKEGFQIFCNFCFEGDGQYLSTETIATLLQGCSHSKCLKLGEQIHGFSTLQEDELQGHSFMEYHDFIPCKGKQFLSALMLLSENSLVDMYGKCGRLHLAEKVSEEMPVRDLGSWNSLIAAYGINGNGISALNVFKQLKNTAWSQESNTLPVWLISWGGQGGLKRQKAFIQKMPFEPGPEVWVPYWVPKSRAWRVALSNVYASVNKWEDAAKVRAEMRRSEELQKEGG